MGDGTEKNPYTREDVRRLIEENGDTAEGLNLSEKVFEEGIDLSELDLSGIILRKAVFPVLMRGEKITYANPEDTNLMCANLQGVDLVCANLEGAILRGAHLERAKLWNVNLEGADLRGAHLEGAVLIDTNLEEAELGSAHLEGADLRGARLNGAYWENVEFTSDTKLDDVDWGNYVLGQESFGDIFLSSTYHRLKSWYAEHGMNDIAAKFYYREKEANRKSLKLFSKSSWRHRLALELIYRGFGYGEGWKRLLFGWIPGVILVLAAAYYFWGSFSSSSFWDTLYYSAASFTALGYGNWAPQPTGWAKGMGAAEALIGVFMMALLLVTFVRKWTR